MTKLITKFEEPSGPLTVKQQLMKLKELQESGKYPTEEMTAYTMEQAGVKPKVETQTTRPVGVGVRVSSGSR